MKRGPSGNSVGGLSFARGRVEVQPATEEVDRRLEMILVAVAASSSFDGHDLAVETLGYGVGDAVLAERYDVVGMLQQHLGNLFHRAQP